MRTKNAKTIETWFFPVDPMYRVAFETWVGHLREDRLFGPGDAFFPKPEIGYGRPLRVRGLSRQPYANAQPVVAVIRSVSGRGPARYTPHSFRKTLAMLGDKLCTMEQRKAWSQNLGHEHLATTISAYMPVTRERQAGVAAGNGVAATIH